MTGLVVAALTALAVLEVAVGFVVLAPLTDVELDVFLLEVAFFSPFFELTIGAAMTLLAEGVGLTVQYHAPFASAHAWPSLADEYGSVCATVEPSGSFKFAWLPVLLRLNPVSAEK